MLMFNNLIDGEWLSDGARAPNVNPSDTKDIVGQAVRGTRAQAEAAISASKAAFPAWSRSTARRPITDTGIVSGALRRTLPGAAARSTAPAEMEK